METQYTLCRLQRSTCSHSPQCRLCPTGACAYQYRSRYLAALHLRKRARTAEDTFRTR